MKKLIRLSLIFVVVLGALVFGGQGYVSRADAQVGAFAPAVPCTTLSYNLRIGQYNDSVLALQTYLSGRGYFTNGSLTGYFGPITYAAVVRYQTDHGVTPTGFVGPVTRGVIQAESCGASPSPVPTPNPSYGVSIYSMSPQNGSVGTTVVLTGTGFTSNGNTVYFGSGAIGDVSADFITCGSYGGPSCTNGGAQIHFTIPSSIGPYCPPGMYCAAYMQLITPGTYPIYVKNTNGTSNTMNFVVGGGAGSPLSISSIDAPNTIAMNTVGSWTVHVVGGQSSTLHYSVLWGDEAYYGSGMMAPNPYPIYSNATFTHAYARAGNFNPQFTVSDDYGNTVSASASVQVTPQYFW